MLPRRLVAAAAISSLGTGLFSACATIFFVGDLGLGAAAVGAALSVGAAAGLLAAPAVGLLADRLGVRPVLVGLLVTRGLAYGGLAAVHGLAGYAALVIVGLAGDQATPPLQQALVGGLAAAGRRTQALGTLRAVRNIGLTAGFLLGGLALQLSSPAAVRAALVVNGLSFAVLAAAVGTLRPGPMTAPVAAVPMATTAPAGTAVPASAVPASAGAEPAATAVPPAHAPPAMRSPRLLGLTLGNGLLALHDAVLFVALPLWVLRRGDLPLALVPALLATNTALTIALQLWLPRTGTGRDWRRGIRTAAGLLVASCALFAAADGLGTALAGVALGLAIVALTAGENVHSVAAWELSYAVAPPGRTAEYLSVFGLSLGVAGLLGPVLLAGVVVGAGPAGWAPLAGMFAAGALLVRRCGDALLHTRAATAVGAAG